MELTKYSNFFGKIGEKLSLLFVVTMAVAFTNMFNGEIVPFYIKLCNGNYLDCALVI